ncbi:hypothetical protein Taro_006582 [Colocasia esculenta]|uniref:WRKY19-like zinc finger domain-containing protein n=1 Tax=Colocasia esculenta TaxID=4460 RepID=A0A843TRJ4_COLES|nr:hypothetical protein [Colocasia esculenta]
MSLDDLHAQVLAAMEEDDFEPTEISSDSDGDSTVGSGPTPTQESVAPIRIRRLMTARDYSDGARSFAPREWTTCPNNPPRCASLETRRPAHHPLAGRPGAHWSNVRLPPIFSGFLLYSPFPPPALLLLFSSPLTSLGLSASRLLHRSPSSSVKPESQATSPPVPPPPACSSAGSGRLDEIQGKDDKPIVVSVGGSCKIRSFVAVAKFVLLSVSKVELSMGDNFRPFGFSPAFSSTVFGELAKTQSGATHCTDTAMRFYSPRSYGSNLKGIKRKRSAINREDDSKDVSSLLLGLGHSPSSSDNSKMSSATVCTMSSVKETDEETSMDLGLNFHLHLSSESSPSPKSGAMLTSNKLETVPVCDLQLSLSTGPSQSVITSASPVSDLNQHILEASVNIDEMPLVDDGSTSVRRNLEGSLISPYSHVVEIIPSNVEPQLLSTKVTTPNGPVTCSSGLTQQRTTNLKICQFQGCGKGARGASGLCIAHGGGRRCQREGCHKGAEGRTVYCKAHGGGRRCQFLGCMKSAEGRTDFCIAHGGGRRCSHDSCTRAARGKSGLCIRHGGGKRCQRENCSKSAEGYSGLCIAHGGGRRCQHPSCSKGAQGSTMFCKAHGGGKRCTWAGCTKGAEGSTSFCKGHGGGKRCSFQGGGVCPKSVHGGTLFCVAHGGGKRCAVPECTKSARGRTDFCVRHGGGKRCKFEGCGKSAQGRTDFCKAHGGGKRCSWGQAGSNVGTSGPPCDRFARGKTGFCAAHSALLQDHRIHGGGALGPAAASHRLQHVNPEKMNPDKTKDVALKEDIVSMTGRADKDFISWNTSSHTSVHLHANSVPPSEGRVHGGSLMAMMRSNAGACAQTGYEAVGNPSEHVLPRKWM